MQAILLITMPFFGLILAGYLAARRHVLPESAIPGLNAFVLYFALPCLLFRLGMRTPVLELLNPNTLMVWLAAALLLVFVVVVFSLNERVGLKDAAFGALVASFPNTGFMGVPMMAALLGPAAAGPVMTLILADLFVTSSLCIALAQVAPKQPLRASLLRSLKGALSNPLPWAIAAGAMCSGLGLRPPAPLLAMVELLASAASPVALFTIGAVLHRAEHLAHRRTYWMDVWPVAAVKLLLHPVLVLALGALAVALGAELTSFQLLVMVLVAGLPSASNVSILAERYGADNGRIAHIILSSTVVAFVSFSLLALALGLRPVG